MMAKVPEQGCYKGHRPRILHSLLQTFHMKIKFLAEMLINKFN